MTILRMKGVRVNSLAEFRKNFDFTNAKDYLREGRLSRWVRELGETDLADELDDLKGSDCSNQTLLDNFVGIFGLKKTVARPPETATPEAEEAAPPAAAKHDSDVPVVYEGFFPDAPEEPTQENIDRTLRIKATLKIIGEQALLAIPPKMRGLVSAPIKITPDTLLDEKICPLPKCPYLCDRKKYGLAAALNKACGVTERCVGFDFGISWGLEIDCSTRIRFTTVGALVEYLSTYDKYTYWDLDILKKYNAKKLAQLNEEKF